MTSQNHWCYRVHREVIDGGELFAVYNTLHDYETGEPVMREEFPAMPCGDDLLTLAMDLGEIVAALGATVLELDDVPVEEELT